MRTWALYCWLERELCHAAFSFKECRFVRLQRPRYVEVIGPMGGHSSHKCSGRNCHLDQNTGILQYLLKICSYGDLQIVGPIQIYGSTLLCISTYLLWYVFRTIVENCPLLSVADPMGGALWGLKATPPPPPPPRTLQNPVSAPGYMEV